jgi:uncharacterized protein (TIGR02246 family)
MNNNLLCIFLLVLVQNITAQTSDSGRLKKLNQDWLNSITKKDSVTLSKILADDFIMINPTGKKLGKKENLALVLSAGTEFTSIDIDSVDIRILTPDTGIVSCWITYVFKTDGKEMTGKNSYQDIYRKRNKDWQAVSAHITMLSLK